MVLAGSGGETARWMQRLQPISGDGGPSAHGTWRDYAHTAPLSVQNEVSARKTATEEATTTLRSSGTGGSPAEVGCRMPSTPLRGEKSSAGPPYGGDWRLSYHVTVPVTRPHVEFIPSSTIWGFTPVGLVVRFACGYIPAVRHSLAAQSFCDPEPGVLVRSVRFAGLSRRRLVRKWHGRVVSSGMKWKIRSHREVRRGVIS